MIQPDDLFNKKPKRVASYRNQTGKYLTINFWRLNEAVLFI